MKLSCKELQNNKRVFIILLFSFSYYSFGQKIIIDNQNSFPIEISYLKNSDIVKNNEKKIVQSKFEISEINILKENINGEINIPLFLRTDETLSITVNQNNIKFGGNKDSIHSYLFNTLKNDLFINIGNYQKSYHKDDVNTFIRLSEIAKSNIISKIQKYNTTTSVIDDAYLKKIERYIIRQWLYSIFINLDSTNNGNTKNKILQYYFNNYIKKDITHYSCESYWDYEIIRKLAKHSKELRLSLAKYNIVEKSDEDDINQFMNKSCQKFYFQSRYNYLNHIKDPKAEFYRTILKEKFNND